MFLERKILGHMYGEPTLQFHAAQGAVDLTEAVSRMGAEHPFTCLVPDLSGGLDPDDAFSKIPYEKGFYFLYHLQDLVGTEGFESFMKVRRPRTIHCPAHQSPVWWRMTGEGQLYLNWFWWRNSLMI